MLIKKSIKTPSGTLQFEGELAGDELDFVIEVGLNIILASGVPPFLKETDSQEKLH